MLGFPLPLSIYRRLSWHGTFLTGNHVYKIGFDQMSASASSVRGLGTRLSLPYTNQCNYWCNYLSMRAYLKFVLQKVGDLKSEIAYIFYERLVLWFEGDSWINLFKTILPWPSCKRRRKCWALYLQEVDIYTTSLEGKHNKLRISTSCLFLSILLLI